jgi:hypothetical protein
MKSERADQVDQLAFTMVDGRKMAARDLVRRVLEILDGAPLTATERALVARFERDDAERARRRAEARRARLAAAATATVVSATAQKKSA